MCQPVLTLTALPASGRYGFPDATHDRAMQQVEQMFFQQWEAVLLSYTGF